jgi:photosystem II stability/assembly factor-like uncharacterized protein
MYRNFILTLALYLNLVTGASAEQSWQRIEVDANVSDARAVALDKSNPQVIYASFKDGVYKTINSGKDWKALAPGMLRKINFIYLDESDTNTVYIATEEGLFKSEDAGGNWKKIFLGKDVLERNVLAVEVCHQPPKTVFIATGNGIFFSTVSRIVWQKAGGKLLDASIFSIAVSPHNPETLFIATSKGLFKTENRLSSCERVFSGFNPESEDVTVDIDSSEEEAVAFDPFLRHIAFDEKKSGAVYAGSRNGLLYSADSGKSWRKQPLSGLFEEKINYVLVSGRDREIFLATENGVYSCRQDSCLQLYKGADFKNVRQIAQDANNNLYLAADRGLFKLPLEEQIDTAGKSQAASKSSFNNEPTIQQVQKEAIKYAEVYPEKISRWRKQARLKAFFPEFDLIYDKTIFTSTSFPQGRSFVGPLDWGLTLKWDLGDFVFSTEQTSIDVRSRLMVQLRGDILNEVTRLYFERRRLQMELARQEKELNENTRLEKGLRLEELTALIDSLTGGYFSRSIAQE